MKTLHLLFSIIFVSILSFSFAGNDPLFIVEEDGDNYVMYLKLGDANNINSISIEGNYSKNGVVQEISLTMSELDVAVLGTGMAEIHQLSSDHDMANYTITVFDKSGNMLEYPMVQIALSDFDTNLAQAE